MGQKEETRPASSCRVQSNKLVTQEQKNLESGRGYGVDIGSGSTVGPDLETGRIISRPTGRGLYQLGPSPSELYRPITDGSITSGYKGSGTTGVGGENRLSQDSALRLPMPSVDRIFP